MKLAILSESPANEAAIRILVNELLAVETEVASVFEFRSRGWPSVLRVLPNVLRHLYYQTDTDALAIIVDSDDSPVHQSLHDQVGGEDMQCRLCQLRDVVAKTTAQLGSTPNRSPLKTAIGLAVPSIEAWYQCGIDPQVNEATWTRGLQSRKTPAPYTRISLKQAVYGTERPSIALEKNMPQPQLYV